MRPGPLARIVHVGEQAAWAHAQGGRAVAVANVRRRSGGHLDSELAARFVAEADAVLAVLDAPDLSTAVIAAEPGNADVTAVTIVGPLPHDDLHHHYRRQSQRDRAAPGHRALERG